MLHWSHHCEFVSFQICRVLNTKVFSVNFDGLMLRNIIYPGFSFVLLRVVRLRLPYGVILREVLLSKVLIIFMLFLLCRRQLRLLLNKLDERFSILQYSSVYYLVIISLHLNHLSVISWRTYWSHPNFLIILVSLIIRWSRMKLPNQVDQTISTWFLCTLNIKLWPTAYR